MPGLVGHVFYCSLVCTCFWPQTDKAYLSLAAAQKSTQQKTREKRRSATLCMSVATSPRQGLAFIVENRPTIHSLRNARHAVASRALAFHRCFGDFSGRYDTTVAIPTENNAPPHGFVYVQRAAPHGEASENVTPVLRRTATTEMFALGREFPLQFHPTPLHSKRGLFSSVFGVRHR